MGGEKLKACPFCGNPEIITGVTLAGGLHAFSCRKCRVTAAFLWKERKKCEEIWNQRVSESTG